MQNPSPFIVDTTIRRDIDRVKSNNAVWIVLLILFVGLPQMIAGWKIGELIGSILR
jgi:hypothetical protein